MEFEFIQNAIEELFNEGYVCYPIAREHFEISFYICFHYEYPLNIITSNNIRVVIETDTNDFFKQAHDIYLNLRKCIIEDIDFDFSIFNGYIVKSIQYLRSNVNLYYDFIYKRLYKNGNEITCNVDIESIIMESPFSHTNKYSF
jgi:hypothetical protein